jgi:hypothetical protein
MDKMYAFKGEATKAHSERLPLSGFPCSSIPEFEATSHSTCTMVFLDKYLED